MIREFWVENFLSIRERQSLSFVTRSQDPYVTVEMRPGERLNKLGIFYGPNASGKSNMLIAIQTIFALLCYPNASVTDKVRSKPAFAFRDDTPTRMGISFYAQSVRYDYQVEYLPTRILKERLDYYPNGQKALMYERTFVDEHKASAIKFGKSLSMGARAKSALTENTLNNHTVLATFNKIALQEGGSSLGALYGWILQHVHEVNCDWQTPGLTTYLKEVKSNPNLYAYHLAMLDKADFNLTGFDVRPVKVDHNEIFRKSIENDLSMSEEEKKRFLNEQRDGVFFKTHSENGDFEVPLSYQSEGTLNFIRALRFLYDLTSGCHVYLLDELDQNLHYDMLKFYLQTFLINSSASQLIFTSQELQLLGEDFINSNRESVWLVDKDKATAASSYQRADTYGLHRNQSLYNAYRIGKLSAVPQVKSVLYDQII
ncbi:MAG: ATP-binding protein [Bacteroidales bacterium]|nr:ATP-binding protein [Bacteroidales bacterium]